MKQLKWLEKNLELVLLAAMLAVMSCLSFANVIMRYVFHNAMSWSDEVCCYLLALSAFYALPCAVRFGVSIKVDTFTTMMSKNVQKVLGLACDVIMIVFLAWLLKGTMEITASAAAIDQASPALGIPVAGIYGCMGVGIALGIVRYVQLIWKVLTGRINVEGDEPENKKEEDK